MNISANTIINEKEYTGELSGAPELLRYRYAARSYKADAALGEVLAAALGLDFARAKKFALLEDEYLVVATSEYKPCFYERCDSADGEPACERE